MIWILWHRRVGDLNQMVTLAKALGQPYVVKKLVFQWPYYAPLAKLKTTSEPMQAPWPDLIFCAEALASVVARKLKRQSGGAAKIVAMARPSGDVCSFDLVLTTAQYRLQKLPHVVELMLPLTEAAVSHIVPVASTDNLLVLIGATSPPELLNADVAFDLLHQIQKRAEQMDANLCVVTSPRTSPEVAAVFAKNLKPPHQVHIWSPAVANPYDQCLSEAAEIIVTSDSVSMLADALATRKSTMVYRLPRKFNGGQKIVEWFFKRSPNNWIFKSGLIEASPDRWALVEKLVKAGYVSWFGDAKNARLLFDPKRDIDLALTAIRRLNSPH